MKKFYFIVPMILALMLQSCTSDKLEQQVSSLEERIAALESVYGEINDNATALNALYRENLLIIKYEERTENGKVVGYDLRLSDGSTLHITYGKEMEGLAPIVGVNDMGQWAFSVDGGETFTEIKGAASPWSKDGKSPVVSVDKYGFWQISLDSGKTWQRIVNATGDPISAVDGKSLAPSSYCFFDRVAYNEETGNMDITLVTGEKFSVPLVAEASITLTYYDEKEGAWVYGNRLNEFPADIRGISDMAFLNVPDGWNLWMEKDKLVVEAPQDGVSGDYTVNVLASTYSSEAKTFSFKFKYEKDLILFDDFLGDDIDYRWWLRYKRGDVAADWCTYQMGDPAQSVVEDGLLKLYAHINGDSFKTGAIWTKGKLTYKPPFRVDCRARFTQMGTGIWYAIWAAPDAGYQYGEIDICEKLNFGTATYHTCHTLYTLNTAAINQKKETYLNEAGETVSNYNQGIAQDAMLPGAFNVFSVEITDDQIVWYVNGTPVHVYKHFVHSDADPLYSQLKPQEKEYYFQNWTFMEQDYNTLLDIAVGGEFVGGVIKRDEFPGQFDIDWIKVKQL